MIPPLSPSQDALVRAWTKCHNIVMLTPLLTVVLLIVSSTLQLQSVEDVDAIVKALFPKAEQMQHLRLGEIASRLGLRPGGSSPGRSLPPSGESTLDCVTQPTAATKNGTRIHADRHGFSLCSLT